MSFYYANAGQPEILRSIQKDETFTSALGEQMSDLLRCSGNRHWIKYNHLCKLFAELFYHGFACVNNLQTLGEEYTGIIQIDSKYIALPSKGLQFVSILLQFCGEDLFNKLIGIVERDVRNNEDLLPDAKDGILKVCQTVRKSVPYVKAIHRSIFYLNGNKLQISKRFTGINYVLVRYWLNVNHSVYGYKVLGVISLVQLALAVVTAVKNTWRKNGYKEKMLEKGEATSRTKSRSAAVIDGKKCVLCLEVRNSTSATLCGHLFCWQCILDWLDQKEECPVCREKIKKSSVVFLKNFQ